MPRKQRASESLAGLRREAEKRFRTTHRDIVAMPIKDVQKLVQELQVHQIELEMQNEELRRAGVELETARDRYTKLYDFAPSGYLTLDTRGDIVEANLRACTLLGVNRKDVLHQALARFIAPDDGETFHRHWQDVLKTGTRWDCQVRLKDQAGVMRWVHLESSSELISISSWPPAHSHRRSQALGRTAHITRIVTILAMEGRILRASLTDDLYGRVVVGDDYCPARRHDHEARLRPVDNDRPPHSARQVCPG